MEEIPVANGATVLHKCASGSKHQAIRLPDENERRAKKSGERMLESQQVGNLIRVHGDEIMPFNFLPFLPFPTENHGELYGKENRVIHASKHEIQHKSHGLTSGQGTSSTPTVFPIGRHRPRPQHEHT